MRSTDEIQIYTNLESQDGQDNNGNKWVTPHFLELLKELEHQWKGKLI